MAVLLYVRHPRSLRKVEDLLIECSVDVCHETVRFWWNRFGPMFAAEIRRQRVSRLGGIRHWRWHVDRQTCKLQRSVALSEWQSTASRGLAGEGSA